MNQQTIIERPRPHAYPPKGTPEYEARIADNMRLMAEMERPSWGPVGSYLRA